MAFKLAERVQQTSTSPGGTGTLNLIAPPTGAVSFVAGIGSTTTTAFMVEDTSGNWEINIGTVTSGTPDTISRGATPIASSNSGALVNFTNGATLTIAIVPINELLVYLSALPSYADDQILQRKSGAWTVRTLLQIITDLIGTGLVPVATARVVITGNVTISTGLTNGTSLGGVTLATGDTVLLVGQTTASQNGLYTVPASGAAPRAAAFATSGSVPPGLRVSVLAGDYSPTEWMLTTTGAITLGTTSLTFKLLSGIDMFAATYSAAIGYVSGYNNMTGFDTTSLNVGASLDTSNGAFTAPFDGYYDFDCIFGAGSAWSSGEINLILTCTGQDYELYQGTNIGGYGFQSMACRKKVKLAKGAVVQLRVYSFAAWTSANGTSINAMRFAGRYLGPV